MTTLVQSLAGNTGPAPSRPAPAAVPSGPGPVPPPRDLHSADLHPSLADPLLTSMNFLNEVAGRHPDALSLAAGAPYEGFYDLEDVHRCLRRFCDHLRTEQGRTEQEVRRTVLQYGRTKGIVHDLIARHLDVDEGIHVDPEALVVTAGFQEALFVTLRALRRDHRDVLLAVTPAYVGATGAARLLDMPVRTVADGPEGVDLADLARRVSQTRAEGLRPRALYLVPDFANPTGTRVPLHVRRAVLDLAEREDLLVLEDNPYGLFPLDGERLPTLKALDARRRVVYLGSLSKSVFPGTRVGFVVADQIVRNGALPPLYLADHLARAKSMLTVNTSPLAQAVVGGRLLEYGCSLQRATAREAEVYQRGLTRLLDGLARRFPGPSLVTWNRPAGGFFVVVTVPFDVTNAQVERSARAHRVLWTPLHHFYEGPGPLRQLRLSCSSLEPSDIDRALDRFADFVRSVAPDA
ncbi:MULTISPECIES: PLP-dependent aminotransferase family protein [unclassified Streptomyces]|uniref:aminotransferase-like domain-containing protein n=1 Tax=unclassified Streptomyces TaxID=2593676 RepID=UPI00224E4514|nr:MULTISPECIES: PLP-dependent aminotransferase family protein [unclassified Streptomyces]MCX4409544.1 PLP-dependent aminotransferase family protein [Streptomyces sp. NBC_01764]MCX5191315.1 PLP-dependent aminotransferase family protein [Streptomyces sp. NBC_00268]